MEDNTKLMELLVENATDYAKKSYDLATLKAADKLSDLASTLLPHSLVFFLLGTFLLFLNFGISLWLGEMVGRFFWGFMIVASFYGVLGMLVHFFMHKWLKKVICNYIVKQMFK